MAPCDSLMELFLTFFPIFVAPSYFLPSFPAPWWLWICSVLCSQAIAFFESSDVNSRKSRMIVMSLVYVVVLTFPFAVVITPFSSLGDLEMPNLKILADTVGSAWAAHENLSNWTKTQHVFSTTMVDKTLFMPMPPHAWPANISALPVAEQMARPWYWLTFAATICLITAAAGTAILSCPAILSCRGQTASNHFQSLVQVEGDSNPMHDTVQQASLSRGQMRILCRSVVLSFLLILTKTVVHAAFTGCLSPTTGLVWEAYCYCFVLGLSWLLVQALALRLLRTDALPVGSFGSCLIYLMPYLGDGFDSLKDASFGGIALQHESRPVKALGCLSLAWLWLLHMQALWNEDELLEMTENYLPVLSLKKTTVTHNPWAGDHGFFHHVREAWQVGWQKCVVLAYKQTTPLKRMLLMKEDGPQGALATTFTVLTGFQSIIVVQNIGIPILRYAFAHVFHDFFGFRALSWIFQELQRALTADLEDQAMHLSAEAARIILTTFRDVNVGLRFMTDSTSDLSPKLQRLVKVFMIEESKEAKAVIVDLTIDNTNLGRVSLSNTQTGDATGEAMAEALKSNTCLQYINLSNTKIGDATGKAMADALKSNIGLLYINLSNTKIGDATGMAVAEALKSNTVLHIINLSNTQIGDATGEAMAEALKSNASLRALDLSDTQIGDATGKAMAEVLKSNTGLHDIKLSNTQIGDATGEAMAEALKSNTGLHYINLSSTQIGDATGEAMAEALKSNASLGIIKLSNTKIGDATGEAMAEALKSNACLEALILGDTQIGDATGKAMAEALKSNTGLHQIKLSNTQIGDATGKAMVEALKSNAGLRVLL